MFKKTWGEDVASHVGTGLLMTIVIILIFAICGPFMMINDAGAVLGGVIMIVALLLAVLFFSTVEAVNRASLFYYAKTGRAPPMAAKHGIHF